MSLNVSDSSPFAPPQPSSNISLNFYVRCLLSKPSSFVFLANDFAVVLLVFPLCVLVFYLRVRRHGPNSHADCFTYHMAAMEMLGVTGYVINAFGVWEERLDVLMAAGFFTSVNWYGQIFFHILTCVERYLAVVHPVVYLKLRKERGVRVRNVCIGLAWLLSLAGMTTMMTTLVFSFLDICLLLLTLFVVSFCSLSVLLVLIRPGPGEPGGDRQKVDQNKVRALHTMAVILAILLLRLGWNVVWEAIFMWGVSRNCIVMATCVWFNLPTSLVLPSLYLHRAGKLPWQRKPQKQEVEK